MIASDHESAWRDLSGARGEVLAQMPPARRVQALRQEAEDLHPEIAEDLWRGLGNLLPAGERASAPRRVDPKERARLKVATDELLVRVDLLEPATNRLSWWLTASPLAVSPAVAAIASALAVTVGLLLERLQ